MERAASRQRPLSCVRPVLVSAARGPSPLCFPSPFPPLPLFPPPPFPPPIHPTHTPRSSSIPLTHSLPSSPPAQTHVWRCCPRNPMAESQHSPPRTLSDSARRRMPRLSARKSSLHANSGASSCTGGLAHGRLGVAVRQGHCVAAVLIPYVVCTEPATARAALEAAHPSPASRSHAQGTARRNRSSPAGPGPAPDLVPATKGCRQIPQAAGQRAAGPALLKVRQGESGAGVHALPLTGGVEAVQVLQHLAHRPGPGQVGQRRRGGRAAAGHPPSHESSAHRRSSVSVRVCACVRGGDMMPPQAAPSLLRARAGQGGAPPCTGHPTPRRRSSPGGPRLGAGATGRQKKRTGVGSWRAVRQAGRFSEARAAGMPQARPFPWPRRTAA